jgi:hypothetical protein
MSAPSSKSRKRFQLIPDFRGNVPSRSRQKVSSNPVQNLSSSQKPNKKNNFFRRIWAMSRAKKIILSLSLATITAIGSTAAIKLSNDKIAMRSNQEISTYNGIALKEGLFLMAPIESRFTKQGPHLFNPNKGGNCSAYAASLAEKLFGLKYVRGNAWDLLEHHERKPSNRRGFTAIERFSRTGEGISSSEMLKLIEAKKIVPGNLIGVFVEGSSENRIDRLYTHVVLYVGKINGEEAFIHDWTDGPRIMSLSALCNFGSPGKKSLDESIPSGTIAKLTPIEVILPPKN